MPAPGSTSSSGNLGELLPFNIWRTDHRINVAPRGITVKRSFGHYLRNNFYLTTSGNFRTPALLNTIQEVGVDRLLFSTDYPFEDMREASEWFDSLEINENDHARIASTSTHAVAPLTAFGSWKTPKGPPVIGSTQLDSVRRHGMPSCSPVTRSGRWRHGRAPPHERSPADFCQARVVGARVLSARKALHKVPVLQTPDHVGQPRLGGVG